MDISTASDAMRAQSDSMLQAAQRERDGQYQNVEMILRAAAAQFSAAARVIDIAASQAAAGRILVGSR